MLWKNLTLPFHRKKRRPASNIKKSPRSKKFGHVLVTHIRTVLSIMRFYLFSDCKSKCGIEEKRKYRCNILIG